HDHPHTISQAHTLIVMDIFAHSSPSLGKEVCVCFGSHSFYISLLCDCVCVCVCVCVCCVCAVCVCVCVCVCPEGAGSSGLLRQKSDPPYQRKPSRAANLS